MFPVLKFFCHPRGEKCKTHREKHVIPLTYLVAGVEEHTLEEYLKEIPMRLDATVKSGMNSNAICTLSSQSLSSI